MCFPMAIPLLVMGAGMAMNAIGNSKASSATSSVLHHERQRQQDMTAQQQGLFENSLKTTGDLTDPTKQQDAINSRDSVLQANIAPAVAAGNYLPGSSSAPAVVNAAQDKSTASTAAYASGIANAMARMGAPGDTLQRVNIANNRDTQGIGQIGTNKRVSADIVPIELQAAAAKGQTWRTLGGLATQIGGAMMGGGGGGINPTNVHSLIANGDISRMLPSYKLLF